FKFTAEGSVTLTVKPAYAGWSAHHAVLHEGQKAMEISVSDTGIGIPQDKQKLIFEAFQQADGTTSRKYGGTGLGLSISREIARLLGGELQVRSLPGEGSTFTLYVPLQSAGRRISLPAPDTSEPMTIAPMQMALPDDRADLNGEPFVLIVEDDATFAGILLDLAHGAGLKGVISSSGSGTVAMVRKMRPSAITLDLGLSDIDGFVLLDLLNHDPETAGIPVHVISGAEQAAHALTIGAAGVTEKPAEGAVLAKLFEGIAESARSSGKKGKTQKPRSVPVAKPRAIPELSGRRILIVDDDIRNIYSLTSVLEAHDVKVLHAERGAEGIRILETAPAIDAALVDIMMPEMDGYETMRRIRANPAIARIPLIAVTAKAMKGDRQKCLDAGASDYISKPVDIDILLALIRVWLGRSQSRRGPVKTKRPTAKVA
ncbi:MAG: response regulator, partial [Chthoniobacterales bacterium]|nr:response regulator [Chthoniobacterales bacterium]